jgi:hypothetical protein
MKENTLLPVCIDGIQKGKGRFLISKSCSLTVTFISFQVPYWPFLSLIQIWLLDLSAMIVYRHVSILDDPRIWIISKLMECGASYSFWKFNNSLLARKCHRLTVTFISFQVPYWPFLSLIQIWLLDLGPMIVYLHVSILDNPRIWIISKLMECPASSSFWKFNNSLLGQEVSPPHTTLAPGVENKSKSETLRCNGCFRYFSTIYTLKLHVRNPYYARLTLPW